MVDFLIFQKFIACNFFLKSMQFWLINTTHALMNGREGISPNVNKFFRAHVDEWVTEIIISRNVVSNVLTSSLKLVSTQFREGIGSVKSYHLQLLIRTTHSNVSLEKIEVITISPYQIVIIKQKLSISNFHLAWQLIYYYKIREMTWVIPFSPIVQEIIILPEFGSIFTRFWRIIKSMKHFIKKIICDWFIFYQIEKTD